MPGMRIDKLLFFLRLAKTRGLAQQWTDNGHIRLNGQRIERAHAAARVGDVLVVPIGHSVHVIELVALPTRRGPAAEAQACYRTLDEPTSSPLARPQIDQPEGSPLP